MSKMLTLIAKRGPGVGVEFLVNVALPYLIFTLARPAVGDVYALLASSSPPIAWSLVELIRKRRLDALSVLVIAGIALSLVALIGGGSVRLLQLREKLVTGLIGLTFLASALFRRPVIYYIARAMMQRQNPAEAESLTERRDDVHVRRTLMVCTLVWGVGLVAETALAVVLVFALPVSEYLLVSPIVGYGSLGALALWTIWYVGRRRRAAALREASGP